MSASPPYLAGALIALAVAAGAFATTRRHSAPPAGPEDVARAYIAARHTSDPGKACSLLSRGQALELAARVSQSAMSDASAEDCPRYVLETSPNSQYTRSNLSEFDAHGYEVDVQGDVADIRPAGLRWPILSAWRRDGRWQLDGAADVGAGFVAGCSSKGAATRFCECVFDTVRRRYPGRPYLQHSIVTQWLTEVFTRQGEVLREAIGACGPGGGAPNVT